MSIVELIKIIKRPPLNGGRRWELKVATYVMAFTIRCSRKRKSVLNNVNCERDKYHFQKMAVS
jgi:hypothetical protein